MPWTEHEAALVEQERRRVVPLLPYWFRVSDGTVEVEELRTRSSDEGMRLFVVATYRQMDLTTPLERRPRLGYRIEVVSLSPAYDGGMVGPAESFVWALEQAVRYMARGLRVELGLDTGWGLEGGGTNLDSLAPG
jgi:hypothetical protein